MKHTAGAMEAKKGALKRIRENIEKIYDDFIVNDRIYIFQKSYSIDENFYATHREAVSTITNIEDLVYFLNDRWLEQIREEDKTETTSESIARLNILIEKDEIGAAKEIGIDWPTQKIFQERSDEFLKHAIKNIIRGASFFFFKRININPDLWSGVIAAKLLRVPIEKVFECEESILNKYFLPKIENDHLIIRVNELTISKDMNIIWDLVKAKQEAYTTKHGYINSLAEYPSRKTDKLITLYSRKGFSHDEIHEELREAGITKKYTKREIRERIKEYKRQTRQPF